MWSKVIQDYNSLQSTVLSTLPTDPPHSGSNPSKSRSASEYDGKSRNQTQQIFDVRLSELDDKWREVDEELETYRREAERGSEMDRELAKRCRMLPLQVCLPCFSCSSEPFLLPFELLLLYPTPEISPDMFLSSTPSAKT
jgi:hypothetical protein